jgi:hypothetical protein
MIGENFHVTWFFWSKKAFLDVSGRRIFIKEREMGWVELRHIIKSSIDKRILEQVDIPSSLLFHLA